MRANTKILLVDDEPYLCELFRSYFTIAGYEQIHVAKDGETALDMINNDQYHAILMDTEMPGRTGFEICSDIRRSNSSIGIFGMSGRNYANQWLESGANQFLLKLSMTRSDVRENLFDSIDSVVKYKN